MPYPKHPVDEDDYWSPWWAKLFALVFHLAVIGLGVLGVWALVTP